MEPFVQLTTEQHFVRYKLYKRSEWVRDDDDLDYLSGIMRIPQADIAEIIDNCAKKCSSYCELLKQQMKQQDTLGGWSAKIAFIGDSLTSEREGYFNVIKEYLADNPDIELMDLGISGAKIADAADGIYESVLDKKPTIAHILIGTNDARSHKNAYMKCNVSVNEYEKILEYMVRLLSDHQIKTIISILPMADNDGMRRYYSSRNYWYENEEILRYNQAIRSVAAKYGAVVNEWYDETEDPKEYLCCDGIHLSGAGAVRVAKGVLGCLTQL